MGSKWPWVQAQSRTPAWGAPHPSQQAGISERSAGLQLGWTPASTGRWFQLASPWVTVHSRNAQQWTRSCVSRDAQVVGAETHTSERPACSFSRGIYEAGEATRGCGRKRGCGQLEGSEVGYGSQLHLARPSANRAETLGFPGGLQQLLRRDLLVAHRVEDPHLPQGPPFSPFSAKQRLARAGQLCVEGIEGSLDPCLCPPVAPRGPVSCLCPLHLPLGFLILHLPGSQQRLGVE